MAWPLCVALLHALPASIPTTTLNNGVAMPRLAISLPKTFPETAQNIQQAFDAGITHFVTANDYLNQHAIARGFAELAVPRSKFFITTMTSPCQCNQPSPHCHRNITDLKACETLTKQEVLSDLAQLNLTQVDLVLLHGPNEVLDGAYSWCPKGRACFEIFVLKCSLSTSLSEGSRLRWWLWSGGLRV